MEAKAAAAEAEVAAASGVPPAHTSEHRDFQKSPSQFSSRSYESWTGVQGGDCQVKDVKPECTLSYSRSHSSKLSHAGGIKGKKADVR